MPTHTIFYSWQSDRPNSINRGFIEDCLDRAIKELKSDEELALNPCVERDTSGVSGSPDIAATIFEKIRNADIFVGDITFIDDGDGRRTPNPNVLIELGYAASCLGWDRVIFVFNSAFGKIGDLPFDLRSRRITSYNLQEGDEKAAQRKDLVGRLRSGIESILHAPDREAQESLQKFLSSLISELIPVLIFGEEIENRGLNPWFDSARDQFQNSADNLREIALTDVAMEQSVDSELDTLSDLLDSAANLPMHSGSFPELSAIVEKAVKKAKEIKAAHIDSVPLSDESVTDVLSMLEENRRKLGKLASRAESLVNQGRWEEVQGDASELGQSVLLIGYYNVDCISFGLGERLREIGRALHLLEIVHINMGGRGRLDIIKGVCDASESFGELVDSLGNAQGAKRSSLGKQ